VLDIGVQQASALVTGSVSPVNKCAPADAPGEHPTSHVDVMRAKAKRPHKEKVLSWAQVVVTGSKR
jgi:hypothetical protein